MKTLGRLAEGALEACWSAAIVLIPLFADKTGGKMFEPAKASLLRSIAALMLLAWLLKALSSASALAGRAVSLARTPLVLAVAAFVAAAGLACALSLQASVSFWGTREHAYGLSMLLAQVAIFAATGANLRSREQLRRVVTALIAASVPVVLYALTQRLGYEPLHVTERETAVERVTSSLGQPVFLAAYLAFVVPFTVLRVSEFWRAGRRFAVASYGLVLALQLAAALFTESRGPLLGFAVASALALLVWSARRGKRGVVVGMWGVAALAALSIGLLQGRAGTGQSRELERAKNTFAVHGSGGEFRSVNWRVAERVLRNRQPLEFVDGDHDTRAKVRGIVGYGPEMQSAISAPFYDEQLPKQFGYFVIARFHNLLWDILLTAGALGLVSWLALECALFWLLFRGLGLLDARARSLTFWGTSAGGAAVGAAGWALWQGLPFVFLGLQLGLLAGFALFLSFAAWRREAAPPLAHEGLLIAVVAAVSAHLVEASFSFVVVATGLLFWLMCALALALVRRGEAIHVSPPASPTLADAVADASILSWLTIALGFLFLGASSLPASAGTALWDGLTLLSQPAGARVPVVAGIVLGSLLLAALLLVLERGKQARQLSSVLGIALSISFVFWLRSAVLIAKLAQRPRAGVSALSHAIELRSELTTTFYVSALLVLLLLACARMPSASSAPSRAWPRGLLAAVSLMLGLSLIPRLGLQPTHAETASAVGDAFAAKNRFAPAEQAYRGAVELAPHVDAYRSQLAKLFAKQARVESASADLSLAKAELAIREAIACNRSEGENATNLAVILGKRAARAKPAAALAMRSAVVDAYQRALRLHPFDPSVRRLWASTQLTLLGDKAGAERDAARAMALAPAP